MPSAFFDIVGTCFSYDAAEETIQKHLGKQLAEVGLNGRIVFHLLLANNERDVAYMEIDKRPYLPGKAMSIWHQTLPRVLFHLGVPPNKIDEWCTEEVVDTMIDEYLTGLTPRPGLQEMMETLEAGGIGFWTCSGASIARVKNYYDLANIPISEDRMWDCSHIGKHKPHPEVYTELMKEWKAKKPDEVMIFAASHAWDVAGAKQCGFQTAYTTEYEHYECVPMWGKSDVVAHSLPELGRAMVAKWGTKK